MTYIPEYKFISFQELNNIINFCDNCDFMFECSEFGPYGITAYYFRDELNLYLIIGNRWFSWAKYGYHHFEYYSTEEILNIVSPSIKKELLFNIDIFL